MTLQFATRESLDAALAFISFAGLLGALLTIWQVRGPYQVRKLPVGGTGQAFAVYALAIGASYALTGSWASAVGAAALALLAAATIRIALPRLTPVGAMEMALAPVALVVLSGWSFFFLRDSGFPDWSLTVWRMSILLVLVGFGFAFASRLAMHALFTHRQWRKPTGPLPALQSPGAPKVSLHLCCYSEPPDMVIKSLDHLARLEYPNYEVLVCDNNTEDPALWRPLEAHCHRLNERLGHERFRFFHVAALSGAKAGALNFCLDHTAPDATLIGVLDSDYASRPDFLSRVVGFFEDARVGYVQTSHDYRGYRLSRYLRMCYWEYLPYYKVDMASINEYGAGFTIGTMCLLRRQALEDCGRWAEWCLTEDSEVSIRIRDLGYKGIFLRSTFGRGLIPEIFEHYRKQRFRWTAGPVQQLCRHWRLFLPRVLGGRSGLDGWSKLLEFQRAFECLVRGPALVLGLAGLGLFLTLTATGRLPRIELPQIVWSLMPVVVMTLLLKRWQWYRLAGCRSWRDMLGGEVARMSLLYVQLAASFAGLSGKPLKWHRTPKFKARSAGLRALRSVLPETLAGALFMLLGFGLWTLREQIGLHVALLAAVGAFMAALTFWCSTAMALLGERDLMSSSRVKHVAEDTTPPDLGVPAQLCVAPAAELGYSQPSQFHAGSARDGRAERTTDKQPERSDA
jgi:cellulose synthase/poly-beta-1,6-N-acetylglucosamine synthase-like glycosyltransferase